MSIGILLEFKREDLSNAKDKLIYDISLIKSGHWLDMSEIQTRWMTAIGECSKLLQKCRHSQLAGVVSKKDNELIRNLEAEWKQIYPIAKEYERLLPRYNAANPEHKLQTFEERTGHVLIENEIDYFGY